MDARQAIKFINDEVVFWPGWRFRADDDLPPWFGPGVINVKVDYHAHETDREEARLFDRYGRQPEMLHLGPLEIPVKVTDLVDDTDVLGVLFKIVVIIQAHEAREALRVRKLNYEAPFHPHRADGERAFDRRGLDRVSSAVPTEPLAA